MSNLYIYGGILVFGSLIANAIMKETVMHRVGQQKKDSMDSGNGAMSNTRV